MERITITIESELLRQIDEMSERHGYQSRSEVFRDMARAELARHAMGADQELDNRQRCYGTLTYVYDHHIRDLPNRLTDNHHLHHDLSVATTHVHVSGDECLEVSILSGTAGQLRQFADSVITQRGVRYGRLHVIPTIEDGTSAETGRSHHHHHGGHADT